LLKSVIAELGGTIVSVIINDLSDDIYYARLVLDADGRHVEVDSRPSDAIALAVRAKVPIYVAENVLDSAGVTLQSSLESQEQIQPTESRDRRKADLDALDEFGKSD
jgi:bifunctional DNase/RNase